MVEGKLRSLGGGLEVLVVRAAAPAALAAAALAAANSGDMMFLLLLFVLLLDLSWLPWLWFGAEDGEAGTREMMKGGRR